MSERHPTMIHTRLAGELRQRFEDWRRQQEEIPPRSKAVCQLLEKALIANAAKTKSEAA